MNPIYERIKQAVPLTEAMRFYGCDPGRNGMARCPFHGDDVHPSMNVRNNFYYCHTCGEHGDVIGFVARYFGLRPSGAVMKLDSDFHLGLIGKRPTRAEVSAIQREREEKARARAAFEAEYRQKTIIRQSLHHALIHQNPAQTGGELTDQYAAACRELDYYDDWFAQHPVNGEGVIH